MQEWTGMKRRGGENTVIDYVIENKEVRERIERMEIRD